MRRRRCLELGPSPSLSHTRRLPGKFLTFLNTGIFITLECWLWRSGCEYCDARCLKKDMRLYCLGCCRNPSAQSSPTARPTARFLPFHSATQSLLRFLMSTVGAFRCDEHEHQACDKALPRAAPPAGPGTPMPLLRARRQRATIGLRVF